MKRISLILIISLALLGCSEPRDISYEIEEIPLQKIDPPISIPTLPSEGVTNNTEGSYCNDYPENKELIHKPFKLIDDIGAGEAALSGTIKVQKEEIWGSIEEKVYLIIDEPAVEGPGDAFYNYFWKMVDSGNTVNFGPMNNLGFGLGIVKEGKISSSATISDEAKEKILDAITYPKKILLTLRVPKYVGRGAPVNFSFACEIE